jgi:hypothetical protein
MQWKGKGKIVGAIEEDIFLHMYGYHWNRCMCMSYYDHCPISSQEACRNVPIASPNLSLHWLVAHPAIHVNIGSADHHENQYLAYIIIWR